MPTDIYDYLYFYFADYLNFYIKQICIFEDLNKLVRSKIIKLVNNYMLSHSASCFNVKW